MGFKVASVSIAVVGAVALAIYALRPAPSLAQLASCFPQSKSGVRDCVVKNVRSLLAQYDADTLFAKVESGLQPSDCHYTGHIIGQEIYAETRGTVEAALAKCPATCSSACSHGVVVAALAADPNVRASLEEISNLNSASLATLGSTFCMNRETCHAVGHLLFQLFGDLDRALNFCDTITAGKQPAWSCYRGVFMENDSPNSSQEIVPRSNDNQIRDPNDLLSPCRSVDARYEIACFHFLFKNQEITFAEKGITDFSEKNRLRIGACGTLSSPTLRAACIEGFGATLLGQTDEAGAQAICATTGDVNETSACSYGYAHVLLDFGHVSRGFDFCAMEEGANKKTCYEAVFDSLSNTKIAPLEGSCSARTDPACPAALQKFMDDPTVSVPR